MSGMAGIRWNYLNNTNINGFIVSHMDASTSTHTNSKISLTNKCSAWPEYYCYTFKNLSLSNNSVFMVHTYYI